VEQDIQESQDCGIEKIKGIIAEYIQYDSCGNYTDMQNEWYLVAI
jgi:hypothetical protein